MASIIISNPETFHLIRKAKGLLQAKRTNENVSLEDTIAELAKSYIEHRGDDNNG